MDDPKIGSLEYAIGSYRWDDDFGGGGVNGKPKKFFESDSLLARAAAKAGAGDPEIVRVSIKAGMLHTRWAPFMGQAQTKRSDLALVSASFVPAGARFKADSRKTFASRFKAKGSLELSKALSR